MTINLDLDLLDASVQILPVTRTVVVLPPVTLPGRQTRWRIVVRGIDGTYITEYPGARVQSITWNPPNTPNEAVVLVPVDESNTQAMRQDLTPHREIELYRNDALIFSGPIWLIRADSTSRKFTVTLKDPTSYFQHRYIGNAQRTNRLTNGSFESNGSGWTLVNGTGVTDTFDTGTKYLGTKSLKLVGTNVNAARYYRQTLHVTSGPLGKGLALSGYCYIANWLRPGAYGGGMLLLRDGVTGPSAYSVAEVVASTPRNRWVRLQTSVRMAPNSSETIEVWIFAIGGTIFWDNLRLEQDEALRFNAGDDQGSVVSTIVNYLQGKGPFGSLAPEKSDLNITPVMPLTGVEIPNREYFFSDHQKGYDGTGPGSTGALDEYLNKSDGIDWRFEPNGRILRGYYPSVGVVRDTVTFTWRYFADDPAQCSTWGIVGWNYAASMEAAANQITELGSAGGQEFEGDPSREEGGASDPTSLGGLTLELVETAATGARQQQLSSRATARLAQLKDPVATPQLVLAEPKDPVTNEVVYPLIARLLPGDHIFLDVLDGSFAMSGEWKVAQVVYNPDDETLTVTPNPINV